MDGSIIDSEKAWISLRQELKGFVRSKVKDKSASEDILQDVFIKMHTNLHRLKDKTRLRSWVYQITRNTITDYFRKEKSFADLEKVNPVIAGEDENLSESFASCLTPMVEKLPGKYKEALKKADFENISQLELAKELKLSHSGAKSRVQRARQLLKKLFTDCCDIVSDKYGNIVSHEPRGRCGCVISH